MTSANMSPADFGSPCASQDEHGLEVSLGLPNAASAPAQQAPASAVDADSDLSKRLAELKGR